MSEISRDDVAHLARLARLTLTEQELTEYATQIDGIVEHVAAIGKVDTTGVKPLSHPTQNVDGDVSVMRDDVVIPSLTAQQALDQAPEQAEQRFQVPQILGGE
ncbi:Asp-tRNA(Asn)/Glu-tRNA(Gln) amidotransferase subunit GatC [Corynebacterium sp. 320]|uniref:Aspartyl/glutamyl-tRNA(Asn/Gln) amidotransferase subunit C n=1 Tax=Corynebacterium zhongnanshanii TaxID=2768834 RepID=A0ABQ6VFP5_9CORY|nr:MULTISPECIES: Asp-tRNA(Asn)/Glu-tRNA(Gln) amidotransferase subunit GatC [Corynebacterium]KAB1503913.1 Asp-tRNA(Asn)/Glu-tRNA(Gln) amidotransferase subunit GatC [Corynebacterium sp. 320]KAB1552988.1 Asp-tRNA(Asn)/Glu-tRNA(Gln) amidotransferase subunit GatC [Corynebacterium sp. 321]KAB1553792.1 Asp-tRNA(Asn)/Glu-tRNA(Gln) amidotransferase subunit GatC [Corynebacterium sp. 319]KAB3523237.1 Asp-tRNA(Asn)/Glu-tRNA(Gln) amidotransferase subunit GatC [Corynebacterium zhongnanshanii]KAB3528049.1 As